MSLTNYPALKKKTLVFVKEESTLGTFAMPASTDAIRTTDVPSPKQDLKLEDSPEIADSRSLQERIAGGFSAAGFTIAVLARPSGAAGTPPEEAVLMKCALGAEAVAASTSVTYSLNNDELPGFSAIIREHHTTHYVSGAKVDSFKATKTKTGAVAYEFGCSAIKALRAGTSEVSGSGSSTTVIDLETGGAKLFDVGALVQVGAETNGGAGYEITAVDLSADTITIGTALSGAPSDGDEVKGFVPTPTYAGYTVEGAKGTVTLDGASLLVTSAEISVANNVAADEEEVNGEDYPSAMDEGARGVTASLSCRFRRKYADFFKRAHEQIQGALVVNAGDTAGKQIAFNLPQAEFDTPSTGGGDLKRTIDVTATGLPTSANEDELTIVYT